MAREGSYRIMTYISMQKSPGQGTLNRGTIGRYDPRIKGKAVTILSLDRVYLDLLSDETRKKLPTDIGIGSVVSLSLFAIASGNLAGYPKLYTTPCMLKGDRRVSLADARPGSDPDDPDDDVDDFGDGGLDLFTPTSRSRSGAGAFVILLCVCVCLWS